MSYTGRFPKEGINLDLNKAKNIAKQIKEEVQCRLKKWLK